MPHTIDPAFMRELPGWLSGVTSSAGTAS